MNLQNESSTRHRKDELRKNIPLQPRRCAPRLTPLQRPLTVPDLKNTTDDAIPNYLNSLKFKQAHHLTDVRLALGYGSFVIAAACFAWDYQFGFEATKLWTTAAVAIYGVLSWALTFWMSNVEAGTIYQGTLPSGEKVGR